jgi:hypothetical protein
VTAGHHLRRTDDLPGVLQAYRDTVVAGGAILACAQRCDDGWLIPDRLMATLQAAVAVVLAGEQAGEAATSG